MSTSIARALVFPHRLTARMMAHLFLSGNRRFFTDAFQCSTWTNKQIEFKSTANWDTQRKHTLLFTVDLLSCYVFALFVCRVVCSYVPWIQVSPCFRKLPDIYYCMVIKSMFVPFLTLCEWFYKFGLFLYYLFFPSLNISVNMLRNDFITKLESVRRPADVCSWAVRGEARDTRGIPRRGSWLISPVNPSAFN